MICDVFGEYLLKKNTWSTDFLLHNNKIKIKRKIKCLQLSSVYLTLLHLRNSHRSTSADLSHKETCEDF